MKIGFFDSGIGGLTVLHEARALMPVCDFLYYADTAHLPYGTKTVGEIRDRVFEAVDFLVSRGAGAVVVACNTATSAAITDVRAKYSLPIIGMEPAVKPALVSVRKRRVLVFATPFTLRQPKFNGLLANYDTDRRVDFLEMQELVTFAENLVFDPETVGAYLRSRLAGRDLSPYGAVVLGCTHFIYFERLIRDFFPPDAAIINGNLGTVRNLQRILAERGLDCAGTGTVEFFRSGEKVEDTARVERYFEMLEKNSFH